jgi:hypothetical protein
MLIEGMQDTEALIQLIRARPKATGSLKQRIEACLDARAEAKLVGNCLSQATISLDWLGMAAREYALAAELAGRRDGAEWGNPPKGNTR